MPTAHQQRPSASRSRASRATGRRGSARRARNQHRDAVAEHRHRGAGTALVALSQSVRSASNTMSCEAGEERDREARSRRAARPSPPGVSVPMKAIAAASSSSRDEQPAAAPAEKRRRIAVHERRPEEFVGVGLARPARTSRWRRCRRSRRRARPAGVPAVSASGRPEEKPSSSSSPILRLRNAAA
mgnify:CR=1 FL=1